MMAHSTALAMPTSSACPLGLSPQVEDSFSTAVTEFREQVERQANTIAPDPLFDHVPIPHREFAQNAVREFNQREIERIQGELVQGQQVLEAKERLTRRKEFSQWKQSLRATTARIRQCVKLVLTFGDFPIEKIIAIASTVNIYSLCTPRFEELVEKFKNLPVLTADRIKQMVKEARPPRKPKQSQQQESSVNWQRDHSGGGRHLAINLYDDELATQITHDAEEQQITAQQVIVQAFRNSKLVEETTRECTEAINEVRQAHIEMQREIHSSKQVIQQQQERIEKLLVQAAAFGGKLPPKTCLASVASVQSSSKSDEGKNPAIHIESFTAWEQLAEAVNCQSDRLLAVARLVSEQERSHFAQMLSEFCEKEPRALDCIEWIPPRLLNSASSATEFFDF